MFLSLKINEMLVWFELLCKLEVAGIHIVFVFSVITLMLRHIVLDLAGRRQNLLKTEKMLSLRRLFISSQAGDGGVGGVQIVRLNGLTNLVTSHANIPARRLNQRCLRKIRSGLSTNSPCWRNNSFLFSTTPLRMSNFNVWNVVKKREEPLLRVNNLLVLVFSITWSNFKDKTFVYLHRYCSKGKGIARHFPSRQRIRCRRAESQACGPISRVLLSAPRVRR